MHLRINVDPIWRLRPGNILGEPSMTCSRPKRNRARGLITLLNQSVRIISYILVVLCVSTETSAGVFEINTVFSTQNQGMWAQNNFDLNLNIPIANDVGWGRRSERIKTSNSVISTIETPGAEILNPKWTTWKARQTLHQKFPNTAPKPGPEPIKKILLDGTVGKYGATIDTASMGRFGLDIESKISGGSIDVNLPVFASFSFSDESIVAGQSFILSSDYTIGSDAQISSISPNGYSNLMLDANMKIDASADVYLGSNEASTVDLLSGYDVDVRLPVLGLDATESGDGLEFLSTPLDAVDEMLLSAGIQKAQFIAKEKVNLKGAEDESKKAQEELAAANKELVEAEAESQQIAKEQAQGESDVKKNDADISEADGVIASYNNQISTNDSKRELNQLEDTKLAEQELGENQRQALVQEKAELAAQNTALEEKKEPGYEAQIAENTKKQDAIDSDLSFDDYVKNERQKLKTDTAKLDAENERLKGKVDATETSKERSQTKKADAVARVDDAKQRKQVSDAKRDDVRSNRDEKLATAKSALSKKNKAKKVDFAINKIADAVTDSIEADWSVPVVQTISDPASRIVSEESGEVQHVLKASGEDQFVEMLLGVDDLLTLAAKTAATAATGGAGAPIIFRLPGLSDEIELTDYLRAEYAVLDLNVGARGYVTQDLKFEPKFEVSLDVGTGTPIVFDLGSDIEIKLPDDVKDFVFTPTIRLKERTVTNEIGIRVEPTAELAAMGLVAGVTPPPELANSFNQTTLEDVIKPFNLPALGCIPIPSQQGGSHSGSPGGGPGSTTNPHNCDDKYPLAGSIDGLDLVPEEYALETELLEITPYANSWELGGFEDTVGEAVTLSVATITTLPGATFDMLTEDWGSSGNVMVANGVAQLTTSSPVSLFTTIDTANQPFHLLFDYRFENHSGGWLSIFLDDMYLDAVQAISSDGFLSGSIYVNDLALLGRSNLKLEFEYLDVTGSQLFLDDIRISGSAVPTPPTVVIFVIGLILILARRQSFRGFYPTTPPWAS